MDNQSSATEEHESRLDRDRARKHAKQEERRKKANRERHRTSESEAQHLQHLAAGQQ